jgi:hypothetical protein
MVGVFSEVYSSAVRPAVRSGRRKAPVRPSSLPETDQRASASTAVNTAFTTIAILS